MATSKLALILSGGGARGAYEAGVVAGLVDVLGEVAFRSFAGTSVGAINASFLASHAHRPDLGVGELVEIWSSLRVRNFLRLNRYPRRNRSMIDVRPFERVVHEGVDWRNLRRNLDEGVLDALFIAALDVDTGTTAVFGDIGRDGHWAPSRDPRRFAVRTRITREHVLASAAIPGVFPPQKIGDNLYYDGGLRFNTPISPTLRAGAERLVVVSPLHRADQEPVIHQTLEDVELLYLAGKMLHAVLLDPFAYDLEVLERFNRLLEVLEATQTVDERAAFDAACVDLRGAPYRKVEALVISPSEDLGALSLGFLREHRRSFLREGLGGLLLAAMTGRLLASHTDLVSYLLFDGRFTRQLIELGRADVAARSAEVQAFFGR